MTPINVKQSFVFCMALLTFALFNARILHAIPMAPEILPIQKELVISSEKDIPRFEWTAGQYLQKGQFLDAASLCKKILDFNKDRLKAAAYLSAAYIGIDDKKKYEKNAIAFKKRYPKSPELFLALAWTYSALGDLKNAETACIQGIKTAASPEVLMMELAGLLLKQGKTKKARTQYENVLKQKNLAAKFVLNANFALCRIGLEQKDFNSVIKRSTTLTDLYPPIPQSYKFLADAYNGKKEYEKAVNTYKKLITANPKSELPFQETALIYNDKIKNSAQAFSYARQGVEKFPDDPKTIDIMGWILYTNQEYSKALQQFKTAIKISDKNPWFYYHAGMAYQKLENKPKAIKNYEQALNLLADQPAIDFKMHIKKLIAQCR